jgi:Predicted membrane protein
MKKRIQWGVLFSLQVQVRIAWLLLILLIVGYALWVGDQAVLRYTTFKATAFDLGNMDQAAWNTLHGRPFEFTNHSDNWYGAPIRLAQHVEPIFFLLSLLYGFGADPRILLVFQTLAMVAGALPVFFLTRKAVPTLPLAAPLMVIGYFLMPALLGQELFDFHAVTLVTPLFLYAMWALLYRRYFWFTLACILAMLCKEEIGMVVALFALLAIWKFRIPRLGTALFVVGMAWSLLCFLVIIPHFDVGQQQNNFWYRYAALGASPAEAAKNILLHPWILVGVFITLDRVYYLAGLLRSTGFLALLAPEWLIPTLPSLAINLLTSDPQYHNGVYHYHAAILPFVLIAAIMGMRRLYLFWYGLRAEKEEQQLYREDEVLGRVRYAAGRPLPWSGPVLALIVRVALQCWRLLVRIGRFLSRRLHLYVVRATLREQALALRARMTALARWISAPRLFGLLLPWFCCMIVLNLIVIWPLLSSFLPDHQPGAREQHIEQLLAMIPPNAVVSAGGNINPHLTDRRYVTVFPELTVSTMTLGKDIPVDYVIVDLDNVSPENLAFSNNFIDVLNQIERTGDFRPIAQADGVILLVRVKM